MFKVFGPFVLNYIFFNLFFTEDRDQTVLQRFKPSSCITLIGEQPNP